MTLWIWGGTIYMIGAIATAWYFYQRFANGDDFGLRGTPQGDYMLSHHTLLAALVIGIIWPDFIWQVDFSHDDLGINPDVQWGVECDKCGESMFVIADARDSQEVQEYNVDKKSIALGWLVNDDSVLCPICKIKDAQICKN